MVWNPLWRSISTLPLLCFGKKILKVLKTISSLVSASSIIKKMYCWKLKEANRTKLSQNIFVSKDSSLICLQLGKQRIQLYNIYHANWKKYRKFYFKKYFTPLCYDLIFMPSMSQQIFFPIHSLSSWTLVDIDCN